MTETENFWVKEVVGPHDGLILAVPPTHEKLSIT